MSNADLESVAARAAKKAVEEFARNQGTSGNCLSEDDAKTLVEATVKSTLLQIGLDHTNPLELQLDFQHLRQWRKAGQDMRAKSLAALIVIFVGGLCSLVLVGIKQWFG